MNKLGKPMSFCKYPYGDSCERSCSISITTSTSANGSTGIVYFLPKFLSLDIIGESKFETMRDFIEEEEKQHRFLNLITYPIRENLWRVNE